MDLNRGNPWSGRTTTGNEWILVRQQNYLCLAESTPEQPDRLRVEPPLTSEWTCRPK
ncbi:hypothetical protein M9458_052516, partial [Cirrhinus mrigala]